MGKKVTINLLNRFWENGIKPIKEALGGKIIDSTNITEPGFIMDGKTTSDALAELNRKLEADQSAIVNPQGRCIGKYNGKPLYEVTLSGDMSKFTESSGFKTIAVPHNIQNVGEIIAASANFGAWINVYFTAAGVAETYIGQITKTTINFTNKAAWGANYKWTVTIKYTIE